MHGLKNQKKLMNYKLFGFTEEVFKSSPLYTLLNECIPDDISVAICSVNSTLVYKDIKNYDLKILVCGECADIESFIKFFGNNIIDIYITFQPDKEFTIGNKSIHNIQFPLAVYNNYNYDNLNKNFRDNIKIDKPIDFSVVISNNFNNPSYLFNKQYSPELCKNDLYLIDKRIFFVNKLNNIIKGGKAFNNPVKSKYEFILPSKFNICFENVMHRYYVTEKIFDSYLSGCIPIYCGDKYVNRIFNKDTFVNAFDYINNEFRLTEDIIKEANEKYNLLKQHPINIYNKQYKNFILEERELFIDKLQKIL